MQRKATRWYADHIMLIWREKSDTEDLEDSKTPNIRLSTYRDLELVVKRGN